MTEYRIFAYKNTNKYIIQYHKETTLSYCYSFLKLPIKKQFIWKDVYIGFETCLKFKLINNTHFSFVECNQLLDYLQQTYNSIEDYYFSVSKFNSCNSSTINPVIFLVI